MQKTVLLLGTALLLGGSYQARAQYKGRGGNTSLGIKAGASLTNYVGADVPDNTLNYRFGFHAGVFANVAFSKLFAFQPELLYSQKGASFNGVDGGIRQHYLDVPLAFHVNTDGFFLEAGPQVGFLLASSSQLGNVSVDNKNAYNTVDVGYLAGLGYQKKHGPGIGFRYNGGFTNVPNASTLGNVTVQPRVRHSAFQLYLTYSFN